VVPRLVGSSQSRPNAYFVAPSVSPAAVTMLPAQGAGVNGAGAISTDDAAALFAFSTRSRQGRVDGRIVLVVRTSYRGEDAVVILRSADVQTLNLTGSRPWTASFSGSGKVSIQSARDGTVLVAWSAATFAATAVDHGDSDRFGFQVKGPDGAVIIDVPVAPLERGEVLARQK
jgi:hypothetical protein